MASIVNLVAGIKRKVFRGNDAHSEAADLAFAPMRQIALRSSGMRCQACHYESPDTKGKKTFLQVHHLDDDHSNNDATNLAALDWMCHAYFHLGCDAPTIGMDGSWSGMASNMRLAYIPEIEPSDLNNLMRAIGAQLHAGDEEQKRQATKLLEALVLFTFSVRDAYGTCHAKDFAAALSQLGQKEYEQRQGMSGLRVVFAPKMLQMAGKQMQQDHVMPLSAWRDFAASIV